MNKIANDFFEIGYSTINDIDTFFTSDLFVYLKSLYNKEPILASTGFIKVIKQEDSFVLYQHLYYDQVPNLTAEFYISLEGLNIESSNIINTDVGFSLFQNGYATIEVSDSFANKCISRYPHLDYYSGPENESGGEPNATFKLHPEIWSKSLLPNVKDTDIQLKENMLFYFREVISFSDVLLSLDLFDVNFLQWTSGRSMNAHNGVDYRSFLNFITYNSEETKKSRDLESGIFDWYDLTFNAIIQKDFTALMNINCNNIMIKKINAQSTTLVLINSFNPKFYHQVHDLREDNSVLYTSTANMTFSVIAQDIKFQW